jgi:heptosyltransferase-3
MRDDGPRALVYRPGSLGDTLVAMPAISEIRLRYPAHRLTLLTERQAAGSGRVSAWAILKETGWFEDGYTYTVKPGAADQLRNMALALRFRARGYDEVFALSPPRTQQQLQNDAFIFRRVVGATNYHAAGAAWTGRDPFSPVEHEGLRLLRIVSPQAGVDTLDGFRLSVPKVDQDQATLVVRELDLRPEQLLVGIGPGSGRPTTAWPAERFAAMGVALLKQFPNVVLLAIGGPDDRKLCAGLCAAWGPRSHNLAGRLGVFGSAAVLARCATFIGNDSGPVHLASLVGVPCVAIFSARNALGHWEPLGRGHIMLEERPECAGCMLDECVHEAYKCLTRIEVGTVVRGAVSLVEARSAACLAG